MKKIAILLCFVSLVPHLFSQSAETIVSAGVQVGSATGLNLNIAGVCSHGQRNRPYYGVEFSAGRWMQNFAFSKPASPSPLTGLGFSAVISKYRPLTQSSWKKSWMPTFNHGYGVGLLQLSSHEDSESSVENYNCFYFCTSFGFSLESPRRVIACFVDARPYVGLKNAPHRFAWGCLFQVGLRMRLSKARSLRPF